MKVEIDSELALDIQHALNMIINQHFTGRDGEKTSSYDLAGRLQEITCTIPPKGLPVHLNGDNDQPTTCPKCGARTNFYQLSNSVLQHHACMNEKCRYEFALELEQ